LKQNFTCLTLKKTLTEGVRGETVLWRVFGPVVGGNKSRMETKAHTQERHNSYVSKGQVYRGDQITETQNGYTGTQQGNKINAEKF